MKLDLQCPLSSPRLWFQRPQEMFGEGAQRLHARHEVRQADVRDRSDHAGEGSEYAHPRSRGEMYTGD